MAIVALRAPLRDLAGGLREIQVEGSVVGEILRDLERTHPRLTGWVLDEQGAIREHVAVFVNGERVGADAPVSAADRMHVLPSISGGVDQVEVTR